MGASNSVQTREVDVDEVESDFDEVEVLEVDLDESDLSGESELDVDESDADLDDSEADLDDSELDFEIAGIQFFDHGEVESDAHAESDYEKILVAACQDNLDVVREYLSSADCKGVNHFDDEVYCTLLSGACFNGAIRVVRLLLQHPQLDPNILASDVWNDGSCDEMSALHVAMSPDAEHENRCDIVKLLLADERVDPNVNAWNKESPLYEAVRWGQLDMIKLLLADPRVNVNHRCSDGQTPFLIAVGDCEAVVEDQKAVIETLLGDPRVDMNIVGVSSTHKCPFGGTAFEQLLISAFHFEDDIGLVRDDHIDLVRGYGYRAATRLCKRRWNIAFGGDDYQFIGGCAAKLMQRESQRLRDNGIKVQILADRKPALHNPLNHCVKQFLKDEFKQNILSPKTIKFLKKEYGPRAKRYGVSQARTYFKDVMQDLKLFVERWGEPEQFDFSFLEN